MNAHILESAVPLQQYQWLEFFFALSAILGVPMNPRVLQEISLRYFLEVVRTGSVSEAAARLDVAPSAVSRQVARIERELGTLQPV